MRTQSETSEDKRRRNAAERARRYRQENPEKHREVQRRKYWNRTPEERKAFSRKQNLKHVWNMTPEEWDQMFAAQGNACAICKTDERPPSGWKLDHCHRTGQKRKILCQHCNIALGHMKDNPELLLAAAEYLKEHNG